MTWAQRKCARGFVIKVGASSNDIGGWVCRYVKLIGRGKIERVGRNKLVRTTTRRGSHLEGGSKGDGRGGGGSTCK